MERSPARVDLEKRLRDLIPSNSFQLDDSNQLVTTAAVGTGGVVVGFIWGWLRGRRQRRK